MNKLYSLALVVCLSCLLPEVSKAASFTVLPGESIQSIIDAANGGDSIELRAGVYEGNLDFKGKDLSLTGNGRSSIIRGDGTAPVIIFANGETNAALIDQVRIAGGGGELAGGLYIKNSSPSISRSWIMNNRAGDKGSGAYILTRGDSSASPIFTNNVFARNKRSSTSFLDPHSVHIENASPTFINNTIVRGDSNGIFVTGNSSPILTNNIFAFNGSKDRGRGICLIGVSSSSSMQLKYNLFFANTKGAILSDSGNYRRISKAAATISEDFSAATVIGNRDGNPRFRRLGRLNLRLRKRSKARNNGDPDIFDVNQSRSDIGASGGSTPNPNLL